MSTKAVSAKSLLRKKYKSILKHIPKDVIQKESLAVFNTLTQSTIYQSSQIISVFASMDGEIDTKIIVKDIFATGKQCLLPSCKGKSMKMIPILSYSDFERLPLNAWGIPEPKWTQEEDEIIPDLVLMPGLVFDSLRNRLGHGKGYYDSYISHLNSLYKDEESKIKTIALALNAQLIPTNIIHVEPHDQKPDILITPSQVIE